MFPDKIKKVFETVGQGGYAVKLHHGSRSFDGMHITEYLIDRLGRKPFVFLVAKYDLLQLLDVL
ncbi:hypothetical protein SDC9_210652 [bioreactor metagenome]|uniref:Uncharacterized protein n=1 Tax=bioreactor metagenome TaxID=1076179 RepID=A0A645JJL2_9ZZZZ